MVLETFLVAKRWVFQQNEKGYLEEFIFNQRRVDMDKLTLTSIWLIKNLCIDTNADVANLEQDITFEGKKIGRYKITIKKIKE
jgi:hypothetical protein